MDPREVNLPQWAQQIIRDLRRELRNATEPLTKQLNLRTAEAERLRNSNATLMELLHCAAKGGHMTAKDIIAVLDGYGMELIKEE